MRNYQKVCFLLVTTLTFSCNFGNMCSVKDAYNTSIAITANADEYYSPSAATAYAEQYWSDYNPSYSNYNSIGGDCANFVSQCLHAGGLEMTDGWYWYSYNNRSASWASCSDMYNYFNNAGYTIIENPSNDEVLEGNPVLYWRNGRWGHAAICVGESDGTPVVAAHNNNHWWVNWTLGYSKTCTILINPPDIDTELGIPYPRPSGNPNIKKGSKGNSVAWVQYALHEKLGYDIGSDGVDGDFGGNTYNAVINFQSDNGLEVDGIVGPATVNKIVERVREIITPQPQPESKWYDSCAAANLGESFYAKIRNQSSGLYFTDTGSTIVGCAVSNEANQIWKFERQSDGSYKIINNSNGYPMDVAGGDTVNGTDVRSWADDNGSAAQRFYIYNIYNSCYIRPLCSDLPLDMTLGDDNHNIATWGYGAEWAPQMFDIEKISIPSVPTLNVTAGTHYSPTKLEWNACENTDFYGVRVYKSDGTLVKYVEPCNTTVYNISLMEGEYYASIASVNSNGYKICDNIPFTVNKGTAYPVACKEFNGHIYSVYDELLWYENADTIAKQMGGHLATITSAEEQEFIFGLIADKTRDAYWIGGNDIQTEGTFVWKTGEKMSFTNWSDEEPNNAGQTENYMEILQNSGKWNDNSNEVLTRGFILEIEPQTELSSGNLGNNSYTVFEGSLNWTEARTYCAMLGGHLAYINDAKEQKYIESLLNGGKSGAYWLGGIRKENEFEWLDQSEITYSNWGENQPDNWQSVENHLELIQSTSQWNDNRNNGERGFICEFEDANKLTVPESNVILEAGEKYTIKANQNNLTFKSSNTDVAVVSKSGVISALENGNAVITIFNEDYDTVQIKIKVVSQKISGDCNADGKLSVADVILLQKWLHAIPDTHLDDWKAADLCEDGKLNVFDFCLMKRKLLNM